MSRNVALALAGAILLAAVIVALALRPEAPRLADAAFTGEQRDEVGRIVREYLVANPEVLEEVLAALEEQQAESQADASRSAVAENAEDIFRSPNAFVAGNPDGDVTLVEFFDYNCGYCRQMMPEIAGLIDSDPDLRVVFKEWPVLREESAQAARVAVAVRREAPDRYFDFHVALLSGQGQVDGERALQVAEDMGIDRDTLEIAIADPTIDDPIVEAHRLGRELGLRGTPTYVVGDEIMMGAVPTETLKEKIAELRENGCEVC